MRDWKAVLASEQVRRVCADIAAVLVPLVFLVAVVGFVAGLAVLGLEIWTAWGADCDLAEDCEARFSKARTAALIFVAFLGAPFVIWRVVEQSRQVNINQQSHYTELFTRAVEQLGADKVVEKDGVKETERNIEVRLGAIYALERVMHDSKRDAGPIIETLSAYVRENCGKPVQLAEEELPQREDFADLGEWGRAVGEAWKKAVPADAPANKADVQAALAVLNRRPIYALPKDRNDRTNRPDLTGANLQRIVLNDKGIVEAELFMARLQGALLKGAKLRGANLSRAKVQGAHLYNVLMQGANLRHAQLQGADFGSARLQGANLTSAELQGADLSFARLQGANFVGAQLQGAVFAISQLTGANLSKADLRDANIIGAELRGAALWCDLSTVEFDQLEIDNQLAEAFGHQTKTKLPDGVKAPAHWSKADYMEGFYEEWLAHKASLGIK
ncbi:pentapeptide repeat-containing protein [Oceanibium sediminis]|uniref:pentapeptide repeat-containing protein n=1 Tax=Oceanibium sediminis TaxID=2026339 RepID=UPI000DD3F2D5|nr:pentapeptide repeat-containing protein [Oceanibium sediminis]